jgi:butyrate kinase
MTDTKTSKNHQPSFILVLNPGSTSTKVAVYYNKKILFLKSIRHKHEDINKFKTIADQYDYRKNIILEELKNADIDLAPIGVIMARGGLLNPIKSGIYEVNEKMKADLMQTKKLGEHASNLGALIASALVKTLPNAKAYIVDPVVVDELQDVARISGHPKFERISIFHALNQKAVARAHARFLGKKYEELNLIVAHIGGGASVGAHCLGRVIDVNNALDGEGPFSPERSGTLPVGALAKLCFSGEYTLPEVMKMIKGEGGMYAYLGTNSGYEVAQQVEEGDEKAKLIFDAMAYQVAKEIGMMATVLKGKVDAILLTGGISFNEDFVENVKQYVEFIAPVSVYPGEDEIEALASNGVRVMMGDAEILEYK